MLLCAIMIVQDNKPIESKEDTLCGKEYVF